MKEGGGGDMVRLECGQIGCIVFYYCTVVLFDGLACAAVRNALSEPCA